MAMVKGFEKDVKRQDQCHFVKQILYVWKGLDTCEIWPPYIHRVQRFITSESAKRMIWDDITVIQKYFWQITVARSKDINKEDTWILNLFRKRLVSANTSVQF